jgi:hypothetical protein
MDRAALKMMLMVLTGWRSAGSGRRFLRRTKTNPHRRDRRHPVNSGFEFGRSRLGGLLNFYDRAA